MFKQDELTGDEGGEAALPAPSVSTHLCLVCGAGGEVWYLLREEG